MRNLTHWIAVLVAAVAPAALAADTKEPKVLDPEDGKFDLKDQLGKYTADLSMPITPSAALVGLAPEQVIQPRTRREFEAGVSNLFKGGGKPVGAIEFLPYYIVNGGKLNFQDYRKRFGYRALTKISLGVATGTPSVDDHALAATAYSLSSVLLDASDPIYYREHQFCVNGLQKNMEDKFKKAKKAEAEAENKKKADEEVKPKEKADSNPKRKEQSARVAQPAASVSTSAAAGSGGGITLSETDAQRAEKLERIGSVTDFTDANTFTDAESVADYKKCVDEHLGEARLWNRSRVAIGFISGSGQEKDGAKRGMDFGKALWLSVQYGFEDWDTLRRLMRGEYVDCLDDMCVNLHTRGQLERSGMLTLMARRTVGKSDLDFDTVGEFKRVDSSLYGLRFTFGSEKRSLFLESSVSRDRLEGETRRTRQHAIGASFRYSDNLWINVASGRRKNFVNDKLDSVVSMGVQWGAEPAPLVKPR